MYNYSINADIKENIALIEQGIFGKLLSKMAGLIHVHIYAEHIDF